MHPDSTSLIGLFVAPLNRLGVKYMVTGSLATSIYGDPRLTHDIDLVIVLPDDDVAVFHAAFDGAEFYVPPIDVIAVEARRALHGHFNIIHTATALKADVYTIGSDPLHHWAIERRQATTIDDQTVWLAPPEYVVLRKLQYFRDGGSDKHVRDVRAMLRQLGAEIDRGVLESEATRLGLQTQLAMVTAPVS
jgi:hypothetical protein